LGDPATGATIEFCGGTLLATDTFSLDNGGSNARNILVAPKGGTFAISSGKTLTVSGTISDSSNGTGPLTIGTDGETGTLLLTGTSTYTSQTFVHAGTLTVNGSVVSPVTVGGNAVLTGTGSISAPAATAAVTVNADGILDPGTAGGIGALSVSGNVAFATGSTFQIQADAGDSDLLSVSGNVTSESGPVLITATGTGSGPWKIMTAASIVPEFTCSDSNMIVKKLAGDTELWLERNSGTVILVR
jgi:autotransporter-associated beta strand protein